MENIVFLGLIVICVVGYYVVKKGLKTKTIGEIEQAAKQVETVVEQKVVEETKVVEQEAEKVVEKVKRGRKPTSKK